MTILRFFANFKRNANAPYKAYQRLMAQSRLPWLYQDVGVPDTIDGRFESATLHLSIVHAALSESIQMHAARQKILEFFVCDMDDCMREIGVSDSGIAKKMTRMSEHLYGRIFRYTNALHAGLRGELHALEAAIIDNVRPKKMDDLAGYAMEAFQDFEKAENLDWLVWKIKDKG